MDDECKSTPHSFPPVEETEEDLCRALWLAVLIQAVLDATGKSGNSLDQAKARDWLAGRGGITNELAAVCDLAGVDFERTRRRFSSLLADKTEGIDFRCLKKANFKNRSHENRKRYFRRADKNARARREKLQRLHMAEMIRGSCGRDNDNFNQQPTEMTNDFKTSTDFQDRWNKSYSVG